MSDRDDWQRRPDSYWRERLTPEQYKILRQKGTERAFSGVLYEVSDLGEYECAGCAQALFRSEEKFDSGTGWPSFFAPTEGVAVALKSDRGFFMQRTEVVCSRCAGHLGHVFDDGPAPTGKRYCINSLALNFVKR